MGILDDITSRARAAMPTGVVDLFGRMASDIRYGAPEMPTPPPRQWAAPGVPVSPTTGVPTLAQPLDANDWQRLQAADWKRQDEVGDTRMGRAITGAGTGAAMGLLVGGPPGAGLGALMGAIGGQNPQVDDLIAGLPTHNLAIIPTARNMPKVLSLLEQNLPARSSHHMADFGYAYGPTRRPVLSNIAAEREVLPPHLGVIQVNGEQHKFGGFFYPPARRVTTVLNTTVPEDTTNSLIHEQTHALQNRYSPASQNKSIYVQPEVDLELYHRQPIEEQAEAYGNYAQREAIPFLRALEVNVAPDQYFPNDNAPLQNFDPTALRDFYKNALQRNMFAKRDELMAQFPDELREGSPALAELADAQARAYTTAMRMFDNQLAVRQGLERRMGPMALKDIRLLLWNGLSSSPAVMPTDGITPWEEYMRSKGYRGWYSEDGPFFFDVREGLQPLLKGPGNPEYDKFVADFQRFKEGQQMVDQAVSEPELLLANPEYAEALGKLVRHMGGPYKPLPRGVRDSRREPAFAQEPWFNALPQEVRDRNAAYLRQAEESRNRPPRPRPAYEGADPRTVSGKKPKRGHSEVPRTPPPPGAEKK